MACLKCKFRAYYNSLCRKHFMEQIEGRVKREIRVLGIIKKDDVLAVKEPICRHFIRRAMGGMPLKIVKGRKDAKTAHDWTLDDDVLDYLMVFFGKKSSLNPYDKEKDIRLFRTVKEDELLAYAKAAKVRFKKKRREAAEYGIKKAVEGLEKEHKEIKYGLLRSVERLRKIEAG